MFHVHILGAYVQDIEFLWSNLQLGGLFVDDNASLHRLLGIYAKWAKKLEFNNMEGLVFSTKLVKFSKKPVQYLSLKEMSMWEIYVDMGKISQAQR